jgi:hypothetical protein
MKPLNLIRAGLAIGILALGAGSAQAATSYVDTIGDGSHYQIGKELTRTAMLGFDQYPVSGDGTGVRPTFAAGGVTAFGTTGVPCSQIWQPGAPGVVDPVSGNYASWLVQPIVPASSGYITKLQFIAQFRTSAGYVQGSGRTAYVDIIEAPGNGQLPATLWQSDQPAQVSLSGAKLGTIVTVSGLTKQVVAGQTYWVVFAPWNQLGVWNASGLDYANLNWGWKSAIPDGTRVGECLFSATNGLGDLIRMPGRALGVKLTGYAQLPAEKSAAEARMMGDGSAVKVMDVVISGKTGAVGPGFFYVEQVDRAAGLRVSGSTTLAEGTVVRVTGTMSTSGVERVLQMDDVEYVASGSVPGALAMASRSVGGGSVPPVNGVTDGVGTNNVGLLVRVSGQVTSASGLEFVLSDGGTADGITCRAATGITIPTSGFAAVTGIVSLEETGGVRKAVILVRKQQDILPL